LLLWQWIASMPDQTTATASYKTQHNKEC